MKVVFIVDYLQLFAPKRHLFSEKQNQARNIFTDIKTKIRIKKAPTSSSTLWAIPFCTGPESLGGVTATSTFAPFSVVLSVNKSKKTTQY